jgi:hypothetical protein
MANNDEPSRRFLVEIDVTPANVTGRLLVLKLDGRESERIVPG